MTIPQDTPPKPSGETRRAIVLLARHRHGQLPDGFAEKLDAIDSLNRLYKILEQVTDVSSLEELDLTL